MLIDFPLDTGYSSCVCEYQDNEARLMYVVGGMESTWMDASGLS